MNTWTGPLALVTPLLLSLGANVVWGVQSGSWVLIAAGLATPLLLALAVERFRAVGRLTGFLLVVQLVGMSLVALVAAAWSWVHTTSLLLEQFRGPSTLETALCVFAPLAVDGLAVLSVVALGTAEGSGAEVGSDPERPKVDTGPPTEPMPRMADSRPEELRDLARVPEPEQTPPPEPVTLHVAGHRDDLSKLTLAELREEAAGRGLAIRGNKTEVTERIRAHRSEQEAS